MAESYHTNLPNVAAAYIRQLKVPVTASSLRQQLIENPFFPSLYSISNEVQYTGENEKIKKAIREDFL